MTEPVTKPDRSAQGEEPPPFLGKWRRVYLVVLGWLALLILFFHWFSRRFAP